MIQLSMNKEHKEEIKALDKLVRLQRESESREKIILIISVVSLLFGFFNLIIRFL